MNPSSLGWRRLGWIVVGLLAVMLGSITAPRGSWAASEIHNVRLGVHGERTRVVVDATGPMNPTIFMLDGPPRIVIDFATLDWRIPDDQLTGGRGMVRSLRTGQFKPGVSRLVIEATGPIKVIQHFAIGAKDGKPDRYVLDLAATDQTSFARSILNGREDGGADTSVAEMSVTPVLKPRIKSEPAPRPEPQPQPKVAAKSPETVAKPVEAPRPVQPAPKAAEKAPAGEKPATGSASKTQSIGDLIASLKAEGNEAAVRPAPERAAPPGPADPGQKDQAVLRRPHPKKVVIIDPGHGGKDPGTKGAETGVREAEITLQTALRLRKSLAASDRYVAVMTRDKDEFVPLRRRVEMARQRNADLFISLHADSIDQRGVRGASVYTLSEDASDREAGELAIKENQSDLIGGVDIGKEKWDVSLFLIELSQRATMNESVRFARILMPELRESTPLLRNSHRFAGFRVLTAPDVPSVLVELGYMSNRDDERQLRSARWQKKVATSIKEAIDLYFDTQETEQAQVR